MATDGGAPGSGGLGTAFSSLTSLVLDPGLAFGALSTLEVRKVETTSRVDQLGDDAV